MWRPLESAISLFRSDASKASPGSLLGEVARPSTTSLNSPWRESVSDALKPDRLASILRAAVNGDADQYLILAEEVEEREPHYRSVLNTRKLAVSGLPINIASAGDDAHNKAIADDVEELLQRAEAEALVLDMLDGLAKGFAPVEIIWKRDLSRWEPERYELRSQRHFVWDRETLSKPRLRTFANSFEGEELAPFKWILHAPKLASGIPLRTGLAMPACLCFMAKRYTVADWLTFLDVFGMPVRIGKFPASMQKRKKELLQAVASIGTDAAAVIPMEMAIEFLESKSSGGNSPFRESAEYWDKQTSKVVLGQTMSSDDGSSLAQSKTHERVRFDIRAADARAIAATLNRDLIIPFVQLNYGPQERYPKAWFKTTEPEDVAKLVESTRVFVNLGGKVSMSELRDRLGYAEPADRDELLKPEAEVKAQFTPPPTQSGGDVKSKPAIPASGGSGGNGANGSELNSLVARVVERLELVRSELSGNAPRSAYGAVSDRTRDVVDDVEAERTAEWHSLVDTNIGVLLEQLHAAKTYDEALQILARLDKDEGVELDVGAFVASLARGTFQVRGVGSATDEVQV